MVRRCHAELVVVHQPVACILGTGAGSTEARAVNDRFKHDNPGDGVTGPAAAGR